MHPDYYQILHVHPDADPEIIKASYRTLMQKLKKHPDLGGDIRNAALINQAYAILKDTKLRKLYDAGSLPELENKSPSAQSKAEKSISSEEKLLCPFCGLTNCISENPTAEELHCTNCKSPLRFIDFDPQWVGRRALRSEKQKTEIEFIESSQLNKTGRGRLEDLSPTGLRFASQSQLHMGNIIKLENGELSAVASVMRCYRDTQSDHYVTAVKFLSLKILKTRGAFVSRKV